ncbi:MAG: hypothetical protein HFE45_00305 [Oscillospiraceae bacterium]|nr:hypothetical protein [Oscillospiraceae bacterium]
MKLTPKQKRMNLLASFAVVILGALGLMLLANSNKPLPYLKRQLEQAGFACVSERNVDPEGLSWVSDTADAVTADGERVLLFRCQSPKGAEDQENSLWEVMNEQARQVTSFVLGDCLVVYAGEDPALKAALDRIA